MSMTSEASSFSVAGPSSTDSSRNGLRPFQGHDHAIYAVCYSPDGRQIATGGEDACIRIWDSNTGKMLIETKDRSSLVNSLCYSPDGKRLMSGDDDGRIHIWSSSDGKLVLGVKAHSSSSTIAYSPDSQHIVTGGGDGRVRIWHAEDMTEMIEFPKHPHRVTSVSFSPDGYRLATGCWDSKVRVFDVVTRVLVVPSLEGHTDTVHTVVYSPNGIQLASCSGDCTIRVWDALTGAMLLGPLEGHSDGVLCLAYSPDGTQLVSASYDKTIPFWEPETGKLIGGPLRRHERSVTALSFAPDGTRFVTGAWDGSMRVWAARTQEIISPKLTEDEKERYQLTGPFRGHTGVIRAVVYFPDGKRIASTSLDQTIRVWDVHTGEQLARLIVRDCQLIAISSDGSRLVSGGNDIRVWDTHSGRPMHVPLKGHSLPSCVQFSLDNQLIASSHGWGNILLWDLQTGKQLRSIKAHDGWVTALSFSADGRRLASSGDDKYICVWDVSTMKIVAGPFKGHTDWIHSVAFSPDGLHIASGSRDATVRVWDAKTGSLLLGPLTAHSSSVTSVSYSPDGTRICSTSDDGTVCLWHATTRNLVLGPLQGHNGDVRSSAFSPDGKHLVTGSDECTIRFWDVATGEMIRFPGRSVSEQLPVDDQLCRSFDEFCNYFLQVPRNVHGHPHPQQTQGTVVDSNYAHASTHGTSVSHFQPPNTELCSIVESGPSDQHTLTFPSLHDVTLPVSRPSNVTPVDFSFTFNQSIPPSEIKPIVDTGLKEVATYLRSKGWCLTFSINPISPVASSPPVDIATVMLPSSFSNATVTVVDDFPHVAPPRAERTAASSSEIDPAEDGNPRKTHKIAQVKQLLMDMLQKIQFPVKERRFPWSTLKDEIERHGYSIINWPHDVPRLNDKGIYSLTVTQADNLYRALTQPNERDRVRFEPRTADSATSSSSTQETARSKRPLDSEDYGGRNKKSKFKVMTPANFAGPSK